MVASHSNYYPLHLLQETIRLREKDMEKSSTPASLAGLQLQMNEGMACPKHNGVGAR
jgi:hypothetical protein